MLGHDQPRDSGVHGVPTILVTSATARPAAGELESRLGGNCSSSVSYTSAFSLWDTARSESGWRTTANALKTERRDVRNPKLDAASTNGHYYRYYAGFSNGFVDDALSNLSIGASDLVLDPWNGAGTTTSAAASRGMQAVGYDINPAAVLIGRSRLLRANVVGSLLPLAVEICQHACEEPAPLRPDLLNTWFGPGTSRELRSIERAVHKILVNHDVHPNDRIFDPSLPQSSLAALFYVALFDTVRGLAQRYVSTNPTWIKPPDGRRLGIRRSDLHRAFQDSTQRLAEWLSTSAPDNADFSTQDRVSVDIAPSSAVPLADGTVDAVVSSPPYCTRLDYVKATLPELAVLGLTGDDVRTLRDRMIGTPTMTSKSGSLNSAEWGDATRSLLDQIATHPSYSSASYYRKYYHQYFAGMWDSLVELHRVVKPGKSAVLVVQDSYYKDVHVDLPGLIGDMSRSAGWAAWTRRDYAVARTMSAMNPGSRAYRKDFGAVESALVLTR